jgi:hypothetical protein
MFTMAALIIARMPTEKLPAFVPLRETSLSEIISSRSEITSSRYAGIRETRPQAVLPVVDDEGRS